MRRVIMASLMSLSLAGLPALVGCEREVESTRKVEVKDDGTVKKEEKKITENTDGTVTKTETKDVSKPAP